VKTIDSGYYHGVERIQFNALCVDNLLIKPSAKVARILPEPVEESDTWRATWVTITNQRAAWSDAKPYPLEGDE
jgi:hypothetical protein